MKEYEELEKFRLVHGTEKTIQLLEQTIKFCELMISVYKMLPNPMKGIRHWAENNKDGNSIIKGDSNE